MALKTVFISRHLESDSPFYQVFPPNTDVHIHAESLIHFQAIPFNRVPDCEWIFFSSRNGVRFFFESLKKENIQLPAPILWGTLGDGTAQTLRAYGKVPDFAGNGHPVQVGTAFSVIAQGKRVLFPTALHSNRSIQAHLSAETIGTDLPVYSNIPKTTFQIPKADVLLFTSPLNVSVYFDAFPGHTRIPSVAIGESTYTALLHRAVSTIHIAPNPSEDALARLALHILENE